MEFFVKVHKSMILSSIWDEDDATRLTWVTLLLMCDQHGYVGASITGIAHMARLTIEQTEAAMLRLLSPDPASRSKSNEGRRVVESERGYVLTNYVAFRDADDGASVRKRARSATQRTRANKRALIEGAEQSLQEQASCQPIRSESDQINPSEEHTPKAWRVQRPDDVREDVWVEWSKMRKTQRAPITPTVIGMMQREAEKARMTLQAVLEMCLMRGWRGFQAAWVQGNNRVQREPAATGKVAAHARQFITPDGTPTVGDLSSYMQKKGDAQ